MLDNIITTTIIISSALPPSPPSPPSPTSPPPVPPDAPRCPLRAQRLASHRETTLPLDFVPVHILSYYHIYHIIIILSLCATPSINTIFITFTTIMKTSSSFSSGFLVLLYMFAMGVLVVMKRKQKRDRLLREQFLNMPLPTVGPQF